MSRRARRSPLAFPARGCFIQRSNITLTGAVTSVSPLWQFSSLPPSRKGPSDASAPGAGPGAGPVRPAMAAVPVKRERPGGNPKPVAKKARQAPTPNQPLPGELPEVTGARRNEYHPERPNEYDAITEQRLTVRHVLERRLEVMRGERVAARNQARRAWFASGGSDASGGSGAPAGAPAPKVEKGLPLAQKLMAKMGWSKGEGLGKSKQGIPAPLRVKKTSARGGTVVAPRGAATGTERG